MTLNHYFFLLDFFSLKYKGSEKYVKQQTSWGMQTANSRLWNTSCPGQMTNFRRQVNYKKKKHKRNQEEGEPRSLRDLRDLLTSWNVWTLFQS